jgi:hypothetical protein
MVRAVKTKPVRSVSKGQRGLLLPGATDAEPWELWLLGGRAAGKLVQMCATPLDNRLRKDTTLALPVSQVFCLPLWLNETDSRQFGGMIPLQLELRGLQRGNMTAVFDWMIVAKDGSRTLVLVGTLPATLPAAIHAEAYESFDLSARCLPFAANALTVWKERDRLAMAITRGTNLVYFQALSEGEVTPRVVQDLKSAHASLSMQDILLPLTKVVLWTNGNPDEIAALEEALGLPVEQEERPAPIPPVPPWKLTPSVVGEAKRLRETRRWRMQAMMVAAILLVLGIGWFVSRLVMVSMKVGELKQWQALHTPAVELVHQGRATWKALGPVVDKDHYPLELLLHVQQAMPAEQLHLTLFEANEAHVLIKGESKNVAGAFDFYNKLKADPFFSSYTLDMGNPRSLPNDLAQFQIQGNRANH